MVNLLSPFLFLRTRRRCLMQCSEFVHVGSPVGLTRSSGTVLPDICTRKDPHAASKRQQLISCHTDRLAPCILCIVRSKLRFTHAPCMEIDQPQVARVAVRMMHASHATRRLFIFASVCYCYPGTWSKHARMHGEQMGTL